MTENYLELIKEARSKNNLNWMAILEVALKSAPEETRAILKRINATDLSIAYYTQKLANADTTEKSS